MQYIICDYFPSLMNKLIKFLTPEEILTNNFIEIFQRSHVKIFYVEATWLS